jgi:hypothetical protein
MFADRIMGCSTGSCSSLGKPRVLLLLQFLPCETLRAATCGARRMDDTAEYDLNRYRKLLVEAVDEARRLALIDLLIKERARDRLKYHLAARVTR